MNQQNSDDPNKRFRAESRHGMRVTTIALPERTYLRLRLASSMTKVVATEIVRTALDEWLTKNLDPRLKTLEAFLENPHGRKRRKRGACT